MRITAGGLHYRELNEEIRRAVDAGARELIVDEVRGQRYIGAGLGPGVCVTVNGVPGNDLAAFMNGAEVVVNANAQDAVGNTMNGGRVIIRGEAGDLLGHSMRGGKILVRDSVGYRAGIHCKAFQDQVPVVVIGTRAGDYLGEYIAGGVMVVLNAVGAGGSRAGKGSPVGDHVGTGMHGGVIFVRGRVEEHQLGAEVGVTDVGDEDWLGISKLVEEYCAEFGLDGGQFRREEFIKLYPRTSRPYGKLYTY